MLKRRGIEEEWWSYKIERGVENGLARKSRHRRELSIVRGGGARGGGERDYGRGIQLI